MTLVRLRNNSSSLRRLPPVADVNGRIEGPTDAIDILPGATVEVDSNRLALYESKAFMHSFEEHNGERAKLEILPPTAPLRTTADLLKAYDDEASKRPAPDAPAIQVGGMSARIAPSTGESNALPVSPVSGQTSVPVPRSLAEVVG